MKNKLLIFMSLILFAMILHPVAGFSQDNIPNRDGMITLNFDIDGLNLKEFNVGIGGKYWFSDAIALVGSLDTTNYTQNTKDQNEFSGTTEKEEKKEDRSSTELTLGAEWHRPVAENISFFVGGHLGSGTSENKIEESDSSASSSSKLEQKINETWSLVAGYVGAEYFFTKRVSLSGYYGYESKRGEFDGKATVDPGSFTPKSTSKRKSDYSDNGFKTSSLILSVYF